MTAPPHTDGDGDGQRATPRRILLVEDHRDTADVLARLLAHIGHEVHIARSMAEAKDVCAADGAFDLIFCDIGLPDGDGRELLPTLRSRCPAATIIALTSYGMTHEVSDILAAGFDAHVLKPVDLQALRPYLT